MAQIKCHKEKKQGRQGQDHVFFLVFQKQFSLESWPLNPKSNLRLFEGRICRDERIWSMQVLNLMREFEACMCWICWENLNCKDWKILRLSKNTRTNYSPLQIKLNYSVLTLLIQYLADSRIVEFFFGYSIGKIDISSL